MTISPEIHKCSWCFEETESKFISWCSCGDSSYVCHDCIKTGVEKFISLPSKIKILKCSICKIKNLNNLPNLNNFSNLILPDSPHLEIDYEEGEIADLESPPEQPYNYTTGNIRIFQGYQQKLWKILIWLSIFLIISWMFAPFSYFIVFRMKNSNNFFNKFYITLSTGMIFGFPITLYFRKIIDRKCFGSE